MPRKSTKTSTRARKANSKATPAPALSIGKHKLTAAVRAGICKWLGFGVSIECASEQEGVSSATFYAWLRRGRAALAQAQDRWTADHPDEDPTEDQLLECITAGELDYVYLVAEVQRAYARAEGVYTKVIHTQMHRDWRAAAWWLERRRPQHYGNRTELSIERDDRAPPSMTTDEIVTELQALGFVQAAVVQAPSTANDTAAPSPARLGAAAITSGGDDDAGRGQG